MSTLLSWLLAEPETTAPTEATQSTYSVEAYARQLRNLLPPGKAFDFESDSWIAGVLLSIAEEFVRVDSRAKTTLIEETDPRTTVERLEDWERILGLPDDAVTEIPDSIGERQIAVATKLASRGGQSRQFYIDLAATLGYTITITEYKVCRADNFYAGDPCYGEGWANAWTVSLPLVAAPAASFHAGSYAGEKLTNYEKIDIQKIIERAAPAHTTVLFSYA
jgi:uncharacterized protein YmfQ (DUF2313 family)